MGLFSSMYYLVGDSDYSSFGVAVGNGKDDVGPWTTHLSSYTYGCWIGGGNFLPPDIMDYSSMIAVDGRGCVGPRTTHFSKKKVFLIDSGIIGG